MNLGIYFSVKKKCFWNFDRKYVKSVHNLGYYGHLKNVNSSKHKHVTSFHYFCLFPVLWSTSLFTFILKYFFGNYMVSENVFLTSVSDISLVFFDRVSCCSSGCPGLLCNLD